MVKVEVLGTNDEGLIGYELPKREPVFVRREDIRKHIRERARFVVEVEATHLPLAGVENAFECSDGRAFAFVDGVFVKLLCVTPEMEPGSTSCLFPLIPVEKRKRER